MLQNAPNCTIKLFFSTGKHALGPGTPVAKSLWGGQEWALAPSLENHKKYLHVGSLLSPCCFFPMWRGGVRGLLSLPLLVIISEGAHASYGDTHKPLEQRALQYNY